VKVSSGKQVKLDGRSRMLRQMAVDALDGGSRGHIGSTMSLIEIFRVLYDDVMLFDANQPQLPNRDRLILSKGHGCIALYVMLAEKGFFDVSELETFCKYNSILGGHPEFGHIPGVEASTGSLGHGLAIGVGMAYAARISNLDYNVFVVLGDGELDEGSVWESALAAGHHNLQNLTVVIDYNKLQSYGPTSEIWNLEPLAEKWNAFGFESIEVDGHDIKELRTAMSSTRRNQRPKAIIAHTVKGRGVLFAEGDPNWHHKSNLTSTEILAIRTAVENA